MFGRALGVALGVAGLAVAVPCWVGVPVLRAEDLLHAQAARIPTKSAAAVVRLVPMAANSGTEERCRKSFDSGSRRHLSTFRPSTPITSGLRCPTTPKPSDTRRVGTSAEFLCPPVIDEVRCIIPMS